MIISVLMLVAGFALLVKGADWLVDSASNFARSAGVSDLVIGLTIVAFGTSAPELVVSLLASIKGNAAISLGNVVGSNIFNILFILGVSALIQPLFAAHGTVWKEIPFVLLASIVLIVQINDPLLDGTAAAVTRSDGLILLGFFIIFMVYIAQVIVDFHRSAASVRSPFRFRYLFLMTIGLAMLILGAHWVVTSSIVIAQALGLSEAFIGLTIVAAGTSLPELATSAVAAYRKNNEIAVGNIVGSNIFNILFILGLSSSVAPMPCPQGFNVDLAFMLGSAIVLFFAMLWGKPRHQIQRVEGAVFLLLYGAYMFWLFKRG